MRWCTAKERVGAVVRHVAGGAGAAGPGVWVSWASWPRGFGGFSFLFLSFFSLFFFSVLFHFKVFSHFLKMCLLHHNYLCNIWHPPNIFVLTFENFGCLSLIHF